ncbi:hypothetical protein P3T76_006263 [Phytophthora citrophthora]|uniref:Elicitin-like protein n=1 Tax=Phytophthora citrophthora TaxID=4793 RepID=A0AAD9GPT7_9STRA|nr:hypothetical protein P3T76_006263 [Phytophthora citrophthora]
MPSSLIISIVAFSLLYVSVQASTTSASCSSSEVNQVQAQVAAIRASLESDTDSSSKASTIPSTCKTALTFDLSTTSEEDGDICSNDCVAWIESVVDSSTCGDGELLMYQQRMTAYLTQCNEHKRVRLQETENSSVEHSNRLRGLAAGQPEGQKLGVSGLLDALLVVTLNNAL